MTPALAVAAALALAAFGLRLLTASGAVAAALVGTAAMMAGASWVALLLFFFISSSALSRWRDSDRRRLTGSLIAKSGRRDAVQVLANGGVFAAAAFLSLSGSVAAWEAAGVGAIAAVSSGPLDTL